MARRRLSQTIPSPAAADVPRAEHPGSRTPPPLVDAGIGAGAPPSGPAPIARVAAEAAGRAALDEVVETLRRAEAEGRMLRAIPLEDIAADHIARDRMGAAPVPAKAAADEEMVALRESIRAHGQRMPIEVTPLRGPASDEGADGGFARGRLPFGLISGWRRLAALRALFEETGDERFATVKALIRRPENAGEAYVAMVEENEIRLGLSQYERARIAAVATERGVFPTEKAALLALFANASRAKRSRIRAFTEIYHALDAALRFPTHLPERLGLRLVEIIRAGRGEEIAGVLARAAPADPEAELAVLEAMAAQLERGQETGEPAREDPGAATGEMAGGAAEEPAGESPGGFAWERIGPELELGLRRGAAPEIRLRGRGVTPEIAARLRAMLAGRASNP